MIVQALDKSVRSDLIDRLTRARDLMLPHAAPRSWHSNVNTEKLHFYVV